MHPELMVLYNGAVERYADLLAQLKAHMEQGTPLGEAFDPIFG